MSGPRLMVDRPWHSGAVDALLTAAAGRADVWTLGYVDATKMLRNAELVDHTARIRGYAEDHHLSLITTYVDLPGENGLGFRSLLARIERSHPRQVLVTTLDHLGSAAVEMNGETSSDTRHEFLQRLRVPIVEVFP